MALLIMVAMVEMCRCKGYVLGVIFGDGLQKISGSCWNFGSSDVEGDALVTRVGVVYAVILSRKCRRWEWPYWGMGCWETTLAGYLGFSNLELNIGESNRLALALGNNWLCFGVFLFWACLVPSFSHFLILLFLFWVFGNLLFWVAR